jgi:phage terminase small subunit
VTNKEKFAGIPEDKELTMKQRLFVEAYFANDYNASEAARVAGYAGDNHNKLGHELLSKPHIKAAVEKRAQEKIKDISLTEEYVIRKLVKTIERAETDNNLTAVLRGIELAAKNLGMLRDRTEITGKDGEAIRYEEVANEADEFVRKIQLISTRKQPELKVVGEDT